MPSSDLEFTNQPYGNQQELTARQQQAGLATSSEGLPSSIESDIVPAASGQPSPSGGTSPTGMSEVPPDGDPFSVISPQSPIARIPTREERATNILMSARNPFMRVAAERILRTRGAI